MTLATQRDRELGLIRGDIERATLAAQQRLENDVRVIEQANAEIHRWNGRLLPVLEGATGQGFGEDRESWFAWWADQEGFVARRPGSIYKPTIDEVVVQPFRGVQIGLGDPPMPTAPIRSNSDRPPAPHTPATLGGPASGPGPPSAPARARWPSRPSGSATRSSPRTSAPARSATSPSWPSSTIRPTRPLRVSLGDESIVATGIHRFWKAGHGWAMARDLKAGDPIRTLGGVARVTSVESDETQPVFNLEVAEGHSFFVGEQGALVHDNSLVQPTPEPFDAAPDLAAVAPAASPR